MSAALRSYVFSRLGSNHHLPEKTRLGQWVSVCSLRWKRIDQVKSQPRSLSRTRGRKTDRFSKKFRESFTPYGLYSRLAVECTKHPLIKMSSGIEIEEIIAKHVAELKLRLSLVETIRDNMEKPCPMSYGHPLRVPCPKDPPRYSPKKRGTPQAEDEMRETAPAVFRPRTLDDCRMEAENPRWH